VIGNIDLLRNRENRALFAWPDGAELDHIDVQARAALPGEHDWQFTRPLANLVARKLARPTGRVDGLLQRHALTEAGATERSRVQLAAKGGVK
jgi:hypothetical protein